MAKNNGSPQTAKKAFDRYQELIRRSYGNDRLHSVLSAAEKGDVVSIWRAIDAGIPLTLLKELPEYFTLGKKGMGMTRLGSDLFYSQRVCDGKEKIVPMKEVPLTSLSYGNKPDAIDDSVKR
jgi:hypothetical protein